ncbi:MAG: YebC/PmpR family DNA-binding transcriptional regulator [Vampirovibrio sp.]|nr:YebC/PmpR family DNA-binding transcriptional regulator [Vampirovibrio sp.]
MAGHSKWANIKRRKGAQDAKKGAIFAKVSREMIVATKLGGPDPAGNFRLRTAIDKAKSLGMPNDSIQRSIDKAAAAGNADDMDAMTYEGYGPGGVAVFIEAMTDNKNRTAGDIRSYFNKYNGNLGADGCVAWIFEEKGLITVKQSQGSEETVFESAIEAGALDFERNDEENTYEIYTDPLTLNTVCDGLTTAGIEVASAEATRTPQNTVNVTELDVAKPLIRLLEAIENHDDVQAVHANVEMDDALMAQLDT